MLLLNGVTPLIDGSMIYGSNYEVEDSIRAWKDGKLKIDNIKTSLGTIQQVPIDEYGLMVTYNDEPGQLFGNKFVNSRPIEKIFYTLFYLFHNQKAAELQQQYQAANDEELFQMTKKFVVGVIQKITFYDWIPAIFNRADFIDFYADGNPKINLDFVTAMLKIISSSGNRVFDSVQDKKGFHTLFISLFHSFLTTPVSH